MQNNNFDKNPQNLYSLHGSLVERQFSIGGARIQAQAISLYLNMGSLFAENAPKLLKKIRQNMNVSK
jgi:hypothetical protein